MAEATPGRLDWRPRAPLLLRAYERVPLNPVARGALLAATVYLAFLALALFFGWFRSADGRFDWSDLSLRLELLQSVILGYAFSAMVLAVRGAVRDLEDLRPWLSCDDDALAERIRTIADFAPLALRLTALLSIGIGVLLPFGDQYWLDGRPPLRDSAFMWHLGRSIVLAWAIGRLGYLVFFLSARISIVGRDWLRPDLLDPRGARIFARSGLRGVALLMGLGILFSLFFLAPYSATSNTLTAGGIVALATAAFLAPILGARRRLQNAKDEELARLRRAIQEERARTLEASATRTPGGRLADLLALERRTSEAHTWPIDFSTALRFGFYLAIGLGSWLGSALVERALASLLD